VSRSPIDSARGFSLLEVLVAFVILTLVVVALFRLFSGALGNASTAEEYSRAVLIAESRLTLVANEKALREGQARGDEEGGRFSWEVTVSPYTPPRPADADDQPEPTLPVRLWSVVSTVTWAGPLKKSRTVRLATLRLAPVE
jgi:general secretion pathway protein I